MKAIQQASKALEAALTEMKIAQQVSSKSQAVEAKG